MTIESDLQGQMEQVIYSYFTNLKHTVEPNKLWNRKRLTLNSTKLSVCTAGTAVICIIPKKQWGLVESGLLDSSYGLNSLNKH